jgi:hypothetical protein
MSGYVKSAKQEARSGVLLALSRLARLGDTAQGFALDAMHAFDEYQRHDPTVVVVRDEGRTVCLHCGKPYEGKEEP